MARPMPVLPEVGSTIVPFGFRAPELSASSIIDKAMRSLIEPPGLARSDFTQTSASPNRRLTRIWGVRPIVSNMLPALIDGLLDAVTFCRVSPTRFKLPLLILCRPRQHELIRSWTIPACAARAALVAPVFPFAAPRDFLRRRALPRQLVRRVEGARPPQLGEPARPQQGH